MLQASKKQIIWLYTKCLSASWAACQPLIFLSLLIGRILHKRLISATKIIRSGSELTKIEPDKESQWGVYGDTVGGVDKRRAAVHSDRRRAQQDWQWIVFSLQFYRRWPFSLQWVLWVWKTWCCCYSWSALLSTSEILVLWQTPLHIGFIIFVVYVKPCTVHLYCCICWTKRQCTITKHLSNCKSIVWIEG